MTKDGKRVVITYGTFDLFHAGHVNLFRRAKELGDILIVGVSTEEFNKIKGKACTYKDVDRMFVVSKNEYVDKVIKETCWEQKKYDIIEHDVDVFVMGDDWKGKFDELNKYCKVIYLPRTEGISTTDVKEAVLEGNQV